MLGSIIDSYMYTLDAVHYILCYSQHTPTSAVCGYARVRY